MSPRIKSAEQSARRERAIAKEALYTAVADSTAPRDPHRKVGHYRQHLIDAHRIIEVLQQKIRELEAERDRIKRQAEYDLSLCVTRREAEEARLAAFRLARGKASDLAEWPEGCPTALSHEIDSIPDIRPKWSK